MHDISRSLPRPISFPSRNYRDFLHVTGMHSGQVLNETENSDCAQGKLVKLYCSMENPGSISLRVEKKSLQLTKVSKKVPEFCFHERQHNRKNTL